MVSPPLLHFYHVVTGGHLHWSDFRFIPLRISKFGLFPSPGVVTYDLCCYEGNDERTWTDGDGWTDGLMHVHIRKAGQPLLEEKGLQITLPLGALPPHTVSKWHIIFLVFRQVRSSVSPTPVKVLHKQVDHMTVKYTIKITPNLKMP